MVHRWDGWVLTLNQSKLTTLEEHDRKNGQPFKPVKPSEIGESCDFQHMRALLRRQSQAGAIPWDSGTKVSSDYLLEKYFGTPHSGGGISGVLEKFLDYLPTQRHPRDPQPTQVRGERTEFHRFDDMPGTWNLIKTMDAAGRFGGGGLSTTAVRDGLTPETFMKDVSTDARPKLTEQEQKAIRRAIDTIKANPGWTAEQRMEFFLSDDPKSDGRIAFRAYTVVIGGYDDLNEAAKSRVTYEGKVIDVISAAPRPKS